MRARAPPPAPTHTSQAKRLLGDTNFMHSLEEFDKDAIPEAVIAKLQRYVSDPQYQPDAVAKQSRAAMSLCMWTLAIDVYSRCARSCRW
jgi:dynein heavy chain